MLGECGVRERDRNGLRKCSLFIQSLQTDDILTDSMAESILAESTSHKRSWRLLSLLPKRGPRAFSSFCSALRDTEQQHLCVLLTDSPERDGERQVSGQTSRRTKIERESGERHNQPKPQTVPLTQCPQTARAKDRAEEVISTTYPIQAPDHYAPFTKTPVKDGEKERDEEVRSTQHLTQGMRAYIEQFGRRQQHQTVSSCVVCLLSHGVEGAIYGTDGQLLQLDWVFEAFDNAHCPLLQNKPKMFFIQACRGGELTHDLCTAAMRNTKRGSWFIQEVNSALRFRARDTHLSDILVQVNTHTPHHSWSH
uniref:Caspase 2, apoptosis-related cysteine peptidase n=1 Tax=Hucho hucho TaxID=62062 RepID=A0A4W5QIC9_9TELE